MEIDTDQLMKEILFEGLREGIKIKFAATYNNPLDKFLAISLEKHGAALQQLLDEAIAGFVSDQDSREHIKTATRHQLAKLLVQRFGGELEKQVNALKSDPTTRAKITLAIQEIVNSQLDKK